MEISKEKKILLVKFHKFHCEECKKKFKLNELEIHKINPELGYEDHRNLKVLCIACHEKFSSAQRIANGLQG